MISVLMAWYGLIWLDASHPYSSLQDSSLQLQACGQMHMIYLPLLDSNPPAPKVLGRDLPDGTRKRLQVYLGGGIFRPKPPVFDRSWRSPSKNTVKNSTEDTCSWTRPSKIGKRKVKKPVFFNFLTSFFWFATSFFAVPQVAGPGGGFLSFWTRFRTDFRRFVIAETLVFTVFFCFLHAWRLASKLPKTS